MAFVSSLGNVLPVDGAGAAPPSSSSSSVSPFMSPLVPSSSFIQWPQSNGAVRNPFGSSSASSSNTSAAPTTTKDAGGMAAAFSGLGLVLDAAGGVVATSNPNPALSAAQQLLAAKAAEKQQEAQLEAEYAVAREARKRQEAAARNAPRPVTALSQALGAFDAEVAQSELLARKSSSSASAPAAGSGTLSRRARQKKEKARERAEGYGGKRTAKSSRDTKRSQRKEKYKHVY